MLLGTVIGHATSTIKHPSLAGWKLLVVQPLNAQRTPDADPVIAIDSIGAGAGSTVVLSSDGKAGRELVKDKKSPVRYFVCGLVD
jgi:ethanolamine utilization protein EutN